LNADLSQFSSLAVKALIQFIYTGTFDVPSALKSRLELLHLAEYTTNEDLCDLVQNEIEKGGFHKGTCRALESD
jgi:hypothetical protein